MLLCSDSHLCHICCHILNKLAWFRSICLKRSLEYPVLFREKGTLNLQRTDIDLQILCTDNECQDINNKKYINYINSQSDQEYIKLEDEQTDSISLVDSEHNDSIKFDNNYYNDKEQFNDENNDSNEEIDVTFDKQDPQSEDVNIKKKMKKSKKKGFEKIVLSVEQQKAELERNRKQKNYLESEFKCFNCALGFLFKDTYQTHMMRHEESNGEYRCSLCTLRFATHAVLRSHTALHSERYRCIRCDALLRPRARTKHAGECYKSVGGDYVACHLCANLFKDTSGLQQHLRRVHNSRTGRVFPCSVCGETCRNQAAVRTHMLKHLKKKFSCEICSAVYSSPYTLNQHKKRHQMTGERHYCTTCGLSYSTRKSLLAHRRNSLNHQQTVFECGKCPRVLPHKRALECHERRAHSDTTLQKTTSRRLPADRRVCHLCGKSFKGNSKLNRHLKEVCEKRADEQSVGLYE
ncbi:PREDICTED: zinc finger and BTB domain-containing protein 41-like isoform X2 [Papilio xuthus]|uniref:Zinc finger and BTB domain-containing protein 41-like isoform X2 n=1 Tax=Papilio xuthus TaxID=66420 RepID=A0AAJ6Z122_PAPXU|nr:PREDICTED: zinc finger and BTB domain-containing protein 41-like isoform X2 [Papilio xuthus]